MIEYDHKKRHKLQETEAFTLLELMVVLAVIAILSAIAVSLMVSAKKSAYEITAKHDLQNFAKAEEMYYTENNAFLGNVGQSVRNDGIASDFVLADFTPSDGISITIISGSANDPFDPSNPYIAQALHENNPGKKYDYNFLTKQMIKQ
jgi:prepilin-type N-terminal cleavage/methylation domain-containing protein